MKQGSLVVIKYFNAQQYLITWGPEVKWVPEDNESTIYVVRDINSKSGVLLEEGCIGYHQNIEIGINIDYVKEIQPPMSSEEVEELAFSHEMELVEG